MKSITSSQNTEYRLTGSYYRYDGDNYFFVSPSNVKEIDPRNLNSRGYILCFGNNICLDNDTPIRVKVKISNATYKDYDGITKRPIFKCEEFEINTDSVDILYLSGKAFKGIGKKTASLIFEKFGEDLYSWVDREDFAAELCSINRITEKKAEEIINNLKKNKRIKEVYEYVYKIEPDDCTYISDNLITMYGLDSCLQKLLDSPYKVGSVVGFSFLQCDMISDCRFDDPTRIKYLLKAAMEKNENSGNIYNNISNILDIAVYIDERSCKKEKLYKKYLIPFVFKNEFITMLEKDKELRCYLNDSLKSEKSIARALKAFIYNKTKIGDISINNVSKYFEEIEPSEEQKIAFRALETTGVKVIIGNPGAGKTTLIKGFINYITDVFPNSKISLCAPTGNAAHRMSNCTGYKAETIHKLLNLSFDNDIPQKVDSDFVIVDEMSMVDTFLFDKLINSVKENVTLILIGDSNQIDSVGPGKVLKDLLAINEIEKYRLTTVYRQDGMSSILINAGKVNKGDTRLTCDNNFVIKRFNTFASVVENIKEIYLDEYSKDNLYNVQILTSIKKKESGVYALNNIFQNLLNKKEKYLIMGKKIFREKDRVIFERNNYELGYTNGTIGVVDKIEENALYIRTEDNYVKIDRENIRDLNLAYSMTIHKSQGSEYNTCIIILSKKYPVMLRRNLLYTAITRAKNKVYIFSEENALEESIQNNKSDERLSSLVDFFYV